MKAGPAAKVAPVVRSGSLQRLDLLQELEPLQRYDLLQGLDPLPKPDLLQELDLSLIHI